MRVLTLSPVKVERLLASLTEREAGGSPVFFRRSYHYRGELLLACRSWYPYDVERYSRLWDRDHIGRHPVDFYAHWKYKNTIFARAVLADCIRYERHSELIFTDVVLLPKPIRFRFVKPCWWDYDLDRMRIPTRYPPTPETLALFWEWCEALDRDETPECPVPYLLARDPRARDVRAGIVKRLTLRGIPQWRTVRTPVNWRITFKERFDAVLNSEKL